MLLQILANLTFRNMSMQKRVDYITNSMILKIDRTCSLTTASSMNLESWCSRQWLSASRSYPLSLLKSKTWLAKPSSAWTYFQIEYSYQRIQLGRIINNRTMTIRLTDNKRQKIQKIETNGMQNQKLSPSCRDSFFMDPWNTRLTPVSMRDFFSTLFELPSST